MEASSSSPVLAGGEDAGIAVGSFLDLLPHPLILLTSEICLVSGPGLWSETSVFSIWCHIAIPLGRTATWKMAGMRRTISSTWLRMSILIKWQLALWQGDDSCGHRMLFLWPDVHFFLLIVYAFDRAKRVTRRPAASFMFCILQACPHASKTGLGPRFIFLFSVCLSASTYGLECLTRRELFDLSKIL